jgi:hypothetical protein
MLSVETQKFEITKTESLWFMITSTLNILPIIFALQKRLLFYGITSFGTGLFSLLYWRNPIHGWRRSIDIFYAKYTYLVYLCSGFYYIPYGLPAIIFYIGASSIVIAYSMNYVYPHIWTRFHTAVHLLSILTKLYILCYISRW